MDNLWQIVLDDLEPSLPHATFITWFKPTEQLSSSPDKLIIKVSNVFAKTQFEKKFDPIIKTSLKKNNLNIKHIDYVVKSTTPKKPSERSVSEEITTITKSAIAKKPTIDTGLNPRYTFDNFVVGSNNDLAVAACQAAVKNPGTKYNPIFLYGGVGLGKTHLMQAVGNEILKLNPSTKVLYTTIEQFYNEFIDMVRFKRGEKSFSEKYRSVDVLIVDDMQFITGKEKSQESFFHTFNDLHQKNRQIIISSDRHPREISTLEDRLKSRFEMGMIIDIQMPDFETRCAIIKAKASLSGTELPDDTTEWLANHYKSNIRELEGSLNHLLAWCEMRGYQPDASTAEGLLGEATRAPIPKHLTPKQIIEKTARYFQITVKEICSPDRSKNIVEPRQIAMYLLRNELGLSYPAISKELSRKDHTTAMHSVEKMTKEIKFNYLLREQISEIRERLYA